MIAATSQRMIQGMAQAGSTAGARAALAAAMPSRAHAQSVLRNSYSGASQVNSNIAMWRPPLRSADNDILRDADKVRARARDLERNHPYAQQAVRASRIGVIGKKLRYTCMPDYRFLGIDQEAAMTWGQEFERVWDAYTHGFGASFDAGLRMNFSQFMALVHDRDFTDGESLVTCEWDAARKWRTCFQAVDVDRLSNPNGAPETIYLKKGIELDRLSAPVGYHIRDSHPGDIALLGTRHMTWTRCARVTDWGRPIVLHTYEMLRPGQTRGMSAFASVIAAMKMGQEYTETALQQAIMQSSYAAVLVSQMNWRDAMEVLHARGPDAESQTMLDLAEENLEAALRHHEAINLRFNGSQIPALFPGEEFKIVTPATGAVAIGDFQSHATKSYAAGTGTDPIAVSQDYSDVNYSSAKMAAATSWQTYAMRRERLLFSNAFPMVAAFLEEAVHNGGLPLPKGVSRLDFYEALPALVCGRFLTQGAPMLDPVKERQAQKYGLEIGVETLQSIHAEEGRDYLEEMDQQAREMHERKQRGLPPINPAAMMVPMVTGSTDETGEEPPKKEPADG